MKDRTHKMTLTALAIVASATLAALPTGARPIRPDIPSRPSPPDRMPRENPAPDDVRQPTVSGAVRQYLMNPHGEVDGLLLNDGTQINFPPGG